MATLVLPRDSEFNDGNVARGTDIRANDQAIRDFINTAQIDSANVNLSANYTWLGLHTFLGGNARIDSSTNTGILSLDYGNTTNARTATFQDFGASYSVMPIDVAEVGTCVNMKLALSGGTLSIVGQNGSALAPSNPGYVVAQNESGQKVLLTFTSSPSFGDSTAGDSDFVGTGTWSWGTTAGVAWATDMPILISVGSDGTTPYAFMSRGPVLTTGAGTNIGYADNAPSAAAQTNVGAMTTTNVTATHANKALTPIGSFRIQKNSSDNWTFTTLASGDGIGEFYNFGTRIFTFPAGQNGATASRFFKANGGTAPDFTTEDATYISYLSGYVKYTFFFDGDGGTDGAGAVTLLGALPVAVVSATNAEKYTGMVFINWNNGLNNQVCSTYLNPADTLSFAIRRNNSASQVLSAQNGDFLAGARSIVGEISYQAF